MKKWMERLRGGEVGFDAFARNTAEDWWLLSCWLARRWPTPSAVAPEDVQQELLIECWQSVPLWLPDGGQPLKKWVVYRSVSSAKGWLHKQRNAYRRRDTSPSRHELPFSSLTDGETDVVGFWAVREPTQERDLELRESMRNAVARCRTDRDHYCVVAIIEARGDIDGAVEWLYSDVDVRRRCQFGNRADARRAIWRTASAVAL